MPPTPKKRGRRRLTALEVLQAKSAFCRSQRIFLRLACSWERFEGSAEATKGAPVPPIGGLTVLRIPSKKGKAGMLLDLGTRVGWRASRGVVLNNHPLRFLSYLGRCGGWAREAGGGEGAMGGDQTSVGDEGWCEGAGQKRAGGPVVVFGHEGGTRAEGSEVERVDKMWWTPGYA